MFLQLRTNDESRTKEILRCMSPAPSLELLMSIIERPIIESSLDHIIKIQPNRNKICAVIGPCLDKNNFEVNIEFERP